MKYNTMTLEDAKYLASQIAPERVLFGEEVSHDYGHDELGDVSRVPDCVVKPLTTEEVSVVLKYANEHLIPVLARGSGSGLVGSAVPVHGGIVMDMTGMNKILELDADNLTVRVQCGVLLIESIPVHSNLPSFLLYKAATKKPALTPAVLQCLPASILQYSGTFRKSLFCGFPHGKRRKSGITHKWTPRKTRRPFESNGLFFRAFTVPDPRPSVRGLPVLPAWDCCAR